MVKVRVCTFLLIMELDFSSPTDLGSPYRRWPHISTSEGQDESPGLHKLELACVVCGQEVFIDG